MVWNARGRSIKFIDIEAVGLTDDRAAEVRLRRTDTGKEVTRSWGANYLVKRLTKAQKVCYSRLVARAGGDLDAACDTLVLMTLDYGDLQAHVAWRLDEQESARQGPMAAKVAAARSRDAKMSRTVRLRRQA